MSTLLPVVRGYRVLRRLGAGGMGQVFLAEDEALERRVAIKMIGAGLAGEGAARTRFLREARAMAGVEHPHVVRIYGFGEADSQPYIVMEYVEGETLAARLLRTRRFPIEDALRVAREVVQALAAAWSRGIVHRDVKPANILLDRDDHVKVADFGLASRQDGDVELTGSGLVVGTPHYISPEQARGEPTDFRSDVYSLGVVLYEMLAGQKPFRGASPAAVLAQQLLQQPPPIRETCPDVPSGLATVLDSMTALTPDARPGSYQDLLRGLTPDGALPVGPGSATSTMPALPKAAARTPSRGVVYRRRAAATALVAAAAAGMALVAHSTPRRHGSFAVAVAPFYGADAESEKEGRVVATLVESELLLRLPDDDVDVLGVAQVGQVVRSPRAARALAERLAVDVVVWGEAVAFQGQVELATRWTPRHGEVAGNVRETLGATAANALEVRRARAAAVADGVAQVYASR